MNRLSEFVTKHKRRLGVAIAVFSLVAFQGEFNLFHIPAVSYVTALTTKDFTNYSTVYAIGYRSLSDGGEGTFTQNGTSCTVDGGLIVKDSAGNCFYRQTSSQPYSVQWWGAYGDEQELQNCTITGAAAVVACSGHAFVATDVSKLGAFYLAGATVSGMRNATLRTTIASINGSNNAVLAANASNTVSSGGVFAWGHDDTTAINNACAATPPGRVLSFPNPGYFLTGAFTYGNATSTSCHDLLFPGHQSLVFSISGHSSNAVERHAGLDSSGQYIPMNIRGGVIIDAMNTGKWALVDFGGKYIYQENVTINRSYQDGWARNTTGNDYIQQLTAINTVILASGLNCILNWANASSPSTGGFIDEVSHHGLECAGISYNGTGLGVSGNQLGAFVYSINTGSGNDNNIQGHSFDGALEFDNGRSVAIGFGSDVNPNAFFWGDGTLSHVLWGSNAGAIPTAYSRWIFNYPQVEGEGSQLTGAYFAGESTSITPAGMEFWLKGSGFYLNNVTNISLGSDCSGSGNGCGNHFFGVGLNGNVAQDSVGAPFSAPSFLLSSTFASKTAPTVSSGFGTSPVIGNVNGTAFFTVTIGTGGSASTGVISLPTTAHGWRCTADDVSTQTSTVFVTKQTTDTASTATLGNFNTSGAAAAWNAGDVLLVSCMGG